MLLFKHQQIESLQQMVQKILFLTVPSNNILNMGFLYYCLFSIFVVTPSVIFLVWYPLRNKYTNFGRG